ncbi:hypothetical protein AVEN_173175-1 [Araneus ventricosus]|uniref:Uncharacterized protein n=1 Tax=Araneus ventricosus TaxID=182803 RepID=A0A4Y2LHZ3_ARAVE|nr:hypothetical protein AVEN_173175-1 [Araneus ventricosus]
MLFPAQNFDQPTHISKLLNSSLPIPKAKIKSIKKIKNEGMVISFESNEDTDILKSEITENSTLNLKIIIKSPGKRHPSAILYDLPLDISEEANTPIPDKLKLRFKYKGSSPGLQNRVFETQAQDLQFPQKLNKIPIPWGMFNVKEFFHCKKCNFCQSF